MKQSRQENPGDANAQQKADSELLKQINQLKSELEGIKTHNKQTQEQNYQREVDAQGRWLDAQISSGSKKFPLMNEYEVLARAEGMLARGVKLSDASIQRLMKESHERIYKQSNDFTRNQMKEQKQKPWIVTGKHSFGAS